MSSTLVFSIPELVDAIATYLDGTSITCCVRLNRFMFDAFTPLLWRHVTLADYPCYLPALFPLFAAATSAPLFSTFRSTPPLSGLIRNSHLIQSVTIKWQDKLEVHNNTVPQLFPQQEGGPSVFFSWPENPSEVLLHKNVKRLYPAPGQILSDETKEEQMSLRLHAHKMLPGHLQAAVFAGLLEKIGQARNMYQKREKNFPRGPIRRWTSLSIISGGTIRPVFASSGIFGHNARWVYRCSQVYRDMAISVVLQAAVRATTIVETVTDFASTSPSSVGDSSPQQDRFSFENLTVERCDGFGAISVFALIQSPVLARSLKRLNIRACANFRSEEMHALLESMPHLKEVDFRARNELLMRYAGIAPRSQRFESDPEELESDCFSELPISFLNRLMMEQQRLRQRADLKTVAGNIDQQEGARPSVRFQSTKGIWPCASGLEILRIGVNGSDTSDKTEPVDLVNYPGGGNPSYKACPGEYQWFYELVAPLTKLRELCLVQGNLDWAQQSPLQIDVKHGLDLWRGLTSMRVFDIEGLILPRAEMIDERHHHADDEDQTRSVDVQWICRHWRRLRRVKGLWYCHQRTETNPAFMPKSVQWLQENRPEIEVPLSLWPREVGCPETEEERQFIDDYLGH